MTENKVRLNNLSSENQGYLLDMIEMFPSIMSTMTVTRTQIRDFVDSTGKPWKSFLNKTTISRGVYDLREYFIDATFTSAAPTIEQNEIIHTVVPDPVPVMENVVAMNHIRPKKHSIQEINASEYMFSMDPDYVRYGHYKDVLSIIKSKTFFTTYITGASGNGKSMMVEQACAESRRPMIRINLTNQSDEEQLIGSKTLVDGNIEINEGPVIIAMRAGAVLLLDEIDGGAANALLALMPVLEGGSFYFKLKDEMIIPAIGFQIFATGNTKGQGNDTGRYIGTNVLNDAFLERFMITLEQAFPNQKVELKIVINRMNTLDCLNQTFAEDLVKWTDTVRRTFNDGGLDETISTRRVCHIVKTYSIFKNKKKAIELCVSRFDSEVKDAFIDLFDKMSAEELVSEPSVDLDHNA